LSEDEQENTTFKFHTHDGKHNITLATPPYLNVPIKLIVRFIWCYLISHLNPLCSILSIARWQRIPSISYRFVVETQM